MQFGLIIPQGWRLDLPGRDFERAVEVARAARSVGAPPVVRYSTLPLWNERELH